jgi:hypothetical protein
MKTRAVALAALPPNGPAGKLQFAIDNVLAADLDTYRRAYAEEHGQEIALDQLVPAILKAFLSRDRGFQKWKKGRDGLPGTGSRQIKREPKIAPSASWPSSNMATCRRWPPQGPRSR